MASMYDEMSDEMAEGDDAAMSGEGETDEAETAELDDEFAMLAEQIGFKGEKAETLKKLIDRCATLRDEGAYSEPAKGSEGGEEPDEFDL